MSTSLNEPITLLASGAKTTTLAGADATAVRVTPGIQPAPPVALAFVLDVTAAATDVGDTLDVFVQAKIGATWLDVVAFTQVLGNGGAKTYVAKLTAGDAQDDFEASASLSAGSVRNLIGQEFRVRYAITDAGTDNASFTFSVVVVPM